MAHVVFKHSVFSSVIFLFYLFEVGHVFFLEWRFPVYFIILNQGTSTFSSLLYGLIINFIVFSA